MVESSPDGGSAKPPSDSSDATTHLSADEDSLTDAQIDAAIGQTPGDEGGGTERTSGNRPQGTRRGAAAGSRSTPRARGSSSAAKPGKGAGAKAGGRAAKAGGRAAKAAAVSTVDADVGAAEEAGLNRPTGYESDAGAPRRPVPSPSVETGQPLPTDPEEEGLALRDYLGLLWRRKWVILVVVVVATTAAFLVSSLQPEQFEASADLIYEKPLDISNPLTGQDYTDPNERNLELRSVGSVLASPDMEARAAKLLQEKGVAVAEVAVRAAPVQEGAGGSASTSSNVVRITVTGDDPQRAAAAADAYAAAFIAWRAERVQAQIADGVDALKKKLSRYQGAAKKSTEYLVMQQRLQDLELLAATATGNFRVLVPAAVPQTPVSPTPIRDALLGFVVGLIVGVGIALLLEQLDTRLRHVDDAGRILRQPVLGRIPRISKALLGESAVVALTHPDGHPAEAFRLLRTNLEFMRVDGVVQSLLVTSSVQGEGKSVCVANLAVSLALGGKKVTVVDADLRRPRQQQYFGLDNRRGVSTVVTGQTSLEDTLQRVELEPTTGANDVAYGGWSRGSLRLPSVNVLTSGPLPPNPGEIVSSNGFAILIETLAEDVDIVIVDSPAMLAVGDTPALAAQVDGLVFLVDMHVATRPMLKQAAEQLGRLPCRILGLVLRVEGADRSGYYYTSSRYYQSSETPRGKRGSFGVKGYVSALVRGGRSDDAGS